MQNDSNSHPRQQQGIIYELKTQLGQKLYSLIRHFEIYGMTSANILLTFDVAVAEATVCLCPKNATRLITTAGADISDNFLLSHEKDDFGHILHSEEVEEEIRLAEDIAAHPLVLQKGQAQGQGGGHSVADERLARELEVLCCFQHYRLVHQTSAVYRFEKRSTFDAQSIEDLKCIEAFTKEKVITMDAMGMFNDVDLLCRT